MKSSLVNLLANIFFALTDTQDMLLSELEHRITTVEQGEMKQDVKHAFNMMKKAAEDYHRRFDLYMDRVRIDSMPDKRHYDDSREDAYEYLRLLLRLADRCNTPEKLAAVNDLLRSMPANTASDEYIDAFKLRR